MWFLGREGRIINFNCVTLLLLLQRKFYIKTVNIYNIMVTNIQQKTIITIIYTSHRWEQASSQRETHSLTPRMDSRVTASQFIIERRTRHILVVFFCEKWPRILT